MSAKDDGFRASGSMPRHDRGIGTAWRVVAGVLLGSLLGVTLGPWLAANRFPLYEAPIPWEGPPPAREDWTRPPGAGEGAVVRTTPAGTILVARAPTPSAAEALALELALARLSRSPELAQARAGRLADWSETVLRGPVATLSPAADCAARLRGWSEAWRAVAAAPSEAGEPGGNGFLDPAPAQGREISISRESEVARFALSADPAGLESALKRESRVARAQLFVRVGPLPGGQREVATMSWRRAWGRRASELSNLAEALEARMSRIERELIARVAWGHALTVEPRIPDPGVILLLAASGSEPAIARPVAAIWGLLALAGAALALLVAVPIARSATRARGARREALARQLEGESEAALGEMLRTPSTTVEAWLQVVSGQSPRRVARATRELAARFLARGERVLVMDGGRHLRLHDFFGVLPRLGFQECMREQLPLLGVVQSGGLAGLFVLAHGSPSRLKSWIPLDRLLEQARPRFTRAVLALDANVSRQAGDALAGRLIDGWWAAADAQTARNARRFSQRLGIPLTGIEPSALEDVTLEALVADIARSSRGDLVASVAPAEAPAAAEAPAPADAPAMAPAIPAAPEGAPALAAAAALAWTEPVSVDAPEPAVAPMLLGTPAPASAAVAASAHMRTPVREAEVLDCDPEVRERLRFLIWMRRLRARSRAEVTHAG